MPGRNVDPIRQVPPKSFRDSSSTHDDWPRWTRFRRRFPDACAHDKNVDIEPRGPDVGVLRWARARCGHGSPSTMVSFH
jgi:hypothetical protein